MSLILDHEENVYICYKYIGLKHLSIKKKKTLEPSVGISRPSEFISLWPLKKLKAALCRLNTDILITLHLGHYKTISFIS